jgi:hypothetical protein
MKQIWLPIPGFEGLYEASDKGIIRSVERKVVRFNGWKEFEWTYKSKELKPKVSNWGYEQVSLYSKGNRTQIYVHIAVALTFIGEKPEGYEVNHVDGNKLNNHLSNLEIVTKSENNKHAYAIGLKKANTTRKWKLTKENAAYIRSSKKQGIELAKIFNVTPAAISSIRNHVNHK